MQSLTTIHNRSGTERHLSEVAEPLSMPTLRDSKFSSFSLSSGLNATILSAAVLAGGWLRFRGLGASDLTADEAPSWLAASAPTVHEAIHQGLQLNPGKLAVHDLILHFWMLVFGDGVTSIRALSAVLGTLAIVLVFGLTRELFASEEDTAASPFAADSSAIAALSSFVFAINIVAIRYSQEGRMYELMLDATLIQLWFFLRGVRRGRLWNYVGTALFTILAGATAFVADLVFLTEGLCLLFALRPAGTLWPYAWNVAVTLLVAGAILARLTPWHLLVQKASFFTWIGSGFMTEYIMGFRGSALRSPVLLVTLMLAVWGVVRGRQKYSEGTGFALIWMFVPVLPAALWLGPTMLLVVTIYSWTPLFAHRAAFTCIVPMCMLIGLGIWELRPTAARIAVLGLVVVLASICISSYDPNAGDVEWGVQWRAATEAALPELKAGRPVNVIPGYGMYAIRYYSRNEHVDPALLSQDNPQAQVLILGDTAESLLPKDTPALHRRYFLERARLRGVLVLATPFALNQPAGVAPVAK